MRILHTSDWHLGQHFMGKTRQAEHRAWCDWLVQTVQAQQADALIVAGDIFDTGTPPSYAREQYNRFIVQMQASGCQLVILAGNHDSVAMLNESKDLLAQLNTHVISSVADNLAEQLLLLKQRNGDVGAIVCAIPYIRPRDVQRSQAGQSAEDKQSDLQQAIAEHYAQLFAKAEVLRDELGVSVPIIGTGHLTTVGVSLTESVREIYVGSLTAFPTDAFPAFDYLALGHIHRPQKVAGLEHIRYSGSPIALSFDEAKQQKELLQVDFDSHGLQAVEVIEIPCFQRLISLSGSLAELEKQFAELAGQLDLDAVTWLEIQVEVDDYYADLDERVTALCAELPVEVLRVRRLRGNKVTGLSGDSGEVLAELTPDEVFAKRLHNEELTEEHVKVLKGLHAQVLESLQEADA
ncbi:exonuclease subunit SbcD [Pseudomonas sp. C27(2019)]|uniref:exonuclease subunit SbcD n=1 Tax=Pseudomonas sp. C27(2019) TaxID=2604941 RepID=UPI001247CD66|nr:exonuclease subunit SbcD [Pseudomonas sp. C27(2019)]QEY58656.1 exonuclease subunit SbcD [Pseudomonas sp. C27(2019)]